MVRLDGLFSLPIMALLLIPSMSSYATSLNIIFFYMTWTTLVLSHSPIRVELVGSACVRILCFILPSLLFFLFDILAPSASVHIKSQGDTGLPCSKKRGSARWKDLRIPAWGLFNVAIGIVLQAAVEYLLVDLLGYRSALRVSIQLPMPWVMARHLAYALMLREVLTYGVHRILLHNSNSVFTRWLTKCHESWFHSLRCPLPFTAHYDHPIVWVLFRFIPTYIPAMLFRIHLLTYLLYLMTVSLEEIFVYSGYTVMPTSIFLGGFARRVEDHMFTRAEGNFGPWGICDFIFGTAVGDDLGDDFMSEAQEEEIQEQVRRAMESSKRRIREGTLRRHTRGRRQGVSERLERLGRES